MKKVVTEICKVYGYTLDNKFRDGGGSGTVYRVVKDEKKYAVKILNNKAPLDRFEKEIDICKKYEDFGLIKIIDNNHITIDGSDYYYYIMPFFTPLKYYERKTFNRTIEIIRQLADILKALSDRGVFHRDIKPNNVVIDEKEQKLYLIDFGLVKDIFNKSDITKDTERIGSLTFIAPERIRPKNTNLINNEKSDVFSFGMTAWALITQEDKGFNGQYSKNDDFCGFSSRGIDFPGISIIERIITDCTYINSDQRPTFFQIIETMKEFDNINKNTSDFYYESLFSTTKQRPRYVIWEDINDIYQVLHTTIKKRYQLEILLNKDDGWLNLEQVNLSNNYPEFLEISANNDIFGCYLLSPKYLLFANFEDIPFYILEVNEIIKFNKRLNIDAENELDWVQSVCEIDKNKFTYQICYFYHDLDGVDSLFNSREYNIILKGKFLICPINYEHTLMENIWSKLLYDQKINFPVFGENDIIDLNMKYTFVEVTKFKSRRRLLSKDEEFLILTFIDKMNKITVFNVQNDRFESKALKEMFGQSDLVFLLKTFEIAHDTISNFSLSPLYFPLDIFWEYYNSMGYDEFWFIRHPEHSKAYIRKSLYLFLYKYSPEQEKYKRLLYEEFKKDKSEDL
jgi:serine/threonine-protein kinase